MKFTKNIEVKNIFNKISYKYDFLNNLLSFGLHRLWIRKLVNLLEPLNGEDWADLCCGTGDLAFLISERVSPMGSSLKANVKPKPRCQLAPGLFCWQLVLPQPQERR